MDHAKAIVEALESAGILAHYDHSGGGCGTIYVGEPRDVPEWGPRYAALIGPFAYYSGEGDDGVFVYVGPDDDGLSDHLSIPPADVETIVGACSRYVAAWSPDQVAADLRAAYDAFPVRDEWKTGRQA